MPPPLDDDDNVDCCAQYVFRGFVCVALAALIGLHAYSHVIGLPANTSGDLSDVKYVIMQLHRGLGEVNEKHEELQAEMERITATLPAVRQAAGRVKDVIESRSYAKHALDIFNYDYQRPDFALETAGGRIVDTGDTVEYPRFESTPGWLLSGLAALACRGWDGARHILRPGSLPGECWAFVGERGEATVRLVGLVHVTGLSVQHIPANISPSKEISSAPRTFQLEGLELPDDEYPHDFGKFEYDREGEPIQYFAVSHQAVKPYRFVRFRVLSNWGNPVYTCVYRVRVHGDLAPGQAVKLPMNGAPHNSLSYADGSRDSIDLNM